MHWDWTLGAWCCPPPPGLALGLGPGVTPTWLVLYLMRRPWGIPWVWKFGSIGTVPPVCHSQVSRQWGAPQAR